MQPNGNMPGAGRSVAGAPVSNVNAKPAPASTPVPKPVEPAFGNGGSVVEGKGGKKTGWILAVVFLLIVAAGGIGFGVWAWMDGNAQKDALNEQISALKQQNSELQDKPGDNDTDIDTDSDGINTADYIYLGNWGVKIRVPDSEVEDGRLSRPVNYAFDGYRLYLWGTVYRSGDQAVGAGVMMEGPNGIIESPALAIVDLNPTGECTGGEKIGDLNDEVLCYEETDSDYLTQVYGQEVMERYIEPTLEKLREYFKDMENYSKI